MIYYSELRHSLVLNAKERQHFQRLIERFETLARSANLYAKDFELAAAVVRMHMETMNLLTKIPLPRPRKKAGRPIDINAAVRVMEKRGTPLRKPGRRKIWTDDYLDDINARIRFIQSPMMAKQKKISRPDATLRALKEKSGGNQAEYRLKKDVPKVTAALKRLNAKKRTK